MDHLTFILKKKIAKKIIILRPVSFLQVFSFEGRFKDYVTSFDVFLQKWALEQADYFLKKDWEEIQLKKIKNIICHAGKNVPYWSNLFKEIKFDPRKITNLEDIKKIPVISRAELKKIDSKELLAININKSRFVQAFTSGSTGEPFKLYKDKKDVFRRRINSFQEFRYVGVDVDDPILILGLVTHTDLDGFGRRIDPLYLEDTEKRYRIVYPAIKNLQPRLLVSTTSSIERFLFFCKKDGFHPRIDRICYMGEPMPPKLKEELVSFFGSIVYSTYGSTEASLIGVQCEEGRQHLAPWMNFVEIVDGKIVVTTFENEVMPFIRYLVGDEGEILDSVCECGRLSKCIKSEGRFGGGVKLANGQIFYTLHITYFIAKNLSEKITKFQFEQKSYDELIIRYVLKKEEDKVFVEDSLKNFLSFHLKGKLSIVFLMMDYIPPNNVGKTPVFIQRI